MAAETESPKRSTAVRGTAHKTDTRRKAVTTLDRASIVDENFVAFLDGWSAQGAPPRTLPAAVPAADVLAVFESQMVSRHLDFAARWLRSIPGWPAVSWDRSRWRANGCAAFPGSRRRSKACNGSG